MRSAQKSWLNLSKSSWFAPTSAVSGVSLHGRGLKRVGVGFEQGHVASAQGDTYESYECDKPL